MRIPSGIFGAVKMMQIQCLFTLGSPYDIAYLVFFKSSQVFAKHDFASLFSFNSVSAESASSVSLVPIEKPHFADEFIYKVTSVVVFPRILVMLMFQQKNGGLFDILLFLDNTPR